MALIKCKECGNEVSTSANSCPKCGAIVPKKKEVVGWGGMIAPIIIAIMMVSFVVNIFLGTAPESTNSGTAPENTQERTGVLSVVKNYDINDIKIRGDLWVLATTNPKVSTICLYVNTTLGTDKYGNPQYGKALIVAEAAELNELRKYKDENFASQNAIFPTDMDKRTCPSP